MAPNESEKTQSPTIASLDCVTVTTFNDINADEWEAANQAITAEFKAQADRERAFLDKCFRAVFKPYGPVYYVVAFAALWLAPRPATTRGMLLMCVLALPALWAFDYFMKALSVLPKIVRTYKEWPAEREALEKASQARNVEPEPQNRA